MRRHAVTLLAGMALALVPDALAAEEQPAEFGSRVLMPEEEREKRLRTACKNRICDVLASRDPNGGNIACGLAKTWREDEIETFLSGGRIDWPWGKARCSTTLELERDTLVRAMSEEEHVVRLKPHPVACTLDRKAQGATYDVTLSVAPVVTFRNGRAVEAQINWGDIAAPMLAFGVLWPGVKLDNTLNVFEGQLVKMINRFVTTKCGLVRGELPSRKVAH